MLGNTTHNFKAGKIADCVEIWESLTTDKWILNVVREVFIEFESVPLQKHVPGEVHLSAGEKKALHDSLTAFESLQIIEECQANERDGLYSNLFPRIKIDQSTRVIFNLKQLNKNVEYVYIDGHDQGCYTADKEKLPFCIDRFQTCLFLCENQP